MSDFKKQKVNQDNTVITKKNNYEDVKLDAYLNKNVDKKSDMLVDSDKKHRSYEYKDKKNNFDQSLDKSVVLKDDKYKVSLISNMFKNFGSSR